MIATQREYARFLRAKGLTYTEINSHLEIKRPKSTLSSWCRGIELLKKHQARIARVNQRKLAINRQKALAVNKDKRDDYLNKLKLRYNHLVNHFNDSMDSSLTTLAILFLTEGGKQSGKLTFGNSDPRIIRLFLVLLRGCFEISEDKFRCTVQCRADQDQAKLEHFWFTVTKIPRTQFYKPRVDTRSIGKKTLRKDYMGVCRIDYFSGYIYNELQAIVNAVAR